MKLKAIILGGEEVRAQFDKATDDVQAAMRDGVNRATLRVLTRTKQKLSDDVLRVKTGRLRRSITTRITEQPGKVEGIVGTVVRYARPHEMGFSGVVGIREHLRRAKQGAVTVRAHTRNVTIPERSFLRSALKELGPEITAEFSKALDQKFKR